MLRNKKPFLQQESILSPTVMLRNIRYGVLLETSTPARMWNNRITAQLCSFCFFLNAISGPVGTIQYSIPSSKFTFLLQRCIFIYEKQE